MRRAPRLAVAAALAACTGEPATDVPPPPADLAAFQPQGAQLFRKNCMLCHGEQGHGDGVRHAYLNPRPPDFSGPSFRERATPQHVFTTIRQGVRGSSMPAWPSLSDEEDWALTAHVLSLAERS